MKRQSRRPVTIAVVALVGALGLSACTASDPTGKRVAEDMINYLAADDDVLRECMLAKVDAWDGDELGAIGDAIENGAADQRRSTGGLAEFEADLTECMNN